MLLDKAGGPSQFSLKDSWNQAEITLLAGAAGRAQLEQLMCSHMQCCSVCKGLSSSAFPCHVLHCPPRKTQAFTVPCFLTLPPGPLCLQPHWHFQKIAFRQETWFWHHLSKLPSFGKVSTFLLRKRRKTQSKLICVRNKIFFERKQLLYFIVCLGFKNYYLFPIFLKKEKADLWVFFFSFMLVKIFFKKNILSSFLLAVNATGGNSRRETEEGRAKKIFAAFSF